MTSNRIRQGFCPHNPKVAGSNPAPATNEIPGQRPFPSDRRGPLSVGARTSREQARTVRAVGRRAGPAIRCTVVWRGKLARWDFAMRGATTTANAQLTFGLHPTTSDPASSCAIHVVGFDWRSQCLRPRPDLAPVPVVTGVGRPNDPRPSQRPCSHRSMTVAARPGQRSPWLRAAWTAAWRLSTPSLR